MSERSKRGALRCFFTGHLFPPVPASVGNEAPFWTCRRCGRKSYTEPPDFWDPSPEIRHPPGI
jgi:hypothetical protein